MKTTDVVLRSLLTAAYHQTMKVLSKGNKKVAKVVTPEGVTGYIATCIPKEALEGLQRKLERQLERIEARNRSTASTKR